MSFFCSLTSEQRVPNHTLSADRDGCVDLMSRNIVSIRPRLKLHRVALCTVCPGVDREGRDRYGQEALAAGLRDHEVCEVRFVL